MVNNSALSDHCLCLYCMNCVCVCGINSFRNFHIIVGSCSPRYMRSTFYTVPCSKDLLNQCRIPLGLVIQPLADVPLNEVCAVRSLSLSFSLSLSLSLCLSLSLSLINAFLLQNNLQVVDHGVGGPIRCNRCKTYMNPNCRFVDGGRQYVCPICQCSNEGEVIFSLWQLFP